MLKSESSILYVRAGLHELSLTIKAAGGIVEFLHEYVNFDEIFVPHFSFARPFWRRNDETSWPPANKSGALGKRIAALPGALISPHPTHAFAGFGDRIQSVLRVHDLTRPCFYPVGELADEYDFSMLLLGCVEESPGFSTVHVAQQRLGLSQLHLLRLFMRWDMLKADQWSSKVAPELPGCSASFDKFYPYYEADDNLLRGEWHGVKWLFVPSARRALELESDLLRGHGRFVDCGRWNCLSCRLRLY